MEELSLQDLNKLNIYHVIFNIKQFQQISSNQIEVCVIPLNHEAIPKNEDYLLISEYDDINQYYTNLHIMLQIKTILTLNDFEGIEKEYAVIQFEIIKNLFQAEAFGSFQYKQ